MSLKSFVKPWRGHAVRHLPAAAGIKIDPLDFTWCGKSDENRWNARGEPTLYLACEKGVALTEFARHFKENRAAGLAPKLHKRKVFRFKIELERTIDLCDPEICGLFSLTDGPSCFMNAKVARATANFLRNATSIQAVFVPSADFMDDLSKWCLVIFLEKLKAERSDYFKAIRSDGYFQIK